MPAQEVLILAMTRMLSGVCTAGFTREPDPISHLRVQRFELLLVVVHLHHMLTSMQSSQMSQKDQQYLVTFPKHIAKRNRMPVHLIQCEIRSLGSLCQHIPLSFIFRRSLTQ